MARRDQIDFQIKEILKSNRDGRPDRQDARHRHLMAFVRLLLARGYSTHWDVHKFARKEVFRLLHDWREAGNSSRTIKNKMVDVRWLARKIGKIDQIPSNKEIGLPKKSLEKNHEINKAVQLTQDHLDQMDERMQLINLLKFEFGLREEEACKFKHGYATAESDSFIQLDGPWCKNGRPRVIEIVNDRQRMLLTKVAEHQKKNNEESMIPDGRDYESYKKTVQRLSTKIGIKGHSFRHHWAQTKFIEVSGGIKPPIAGGPAYSSLSKSEKVRWDKGAARVNQELGHGKGRDDITRDYIGSRA